MEKIPKTDLSMNNNDGSREMAENFRIFFDLSPDFLFVLDGAGNIILANRTVRGVLGYGEGALKGMSVLSLHPENRREEAGRIVEDMLAGRRDHCPVPLLTRDGREIAVETRVVQGVWNGEPCLFGYSRNLEQLKRSEEKFRSAFDSSAVLMAISSMAGGRFVDVNAAFCETLGYGRNQVIGKTSSELGLFSEPQIREEMVRDLVAEGRVRNREVTIQDARGRVLDGLFTASRLKGIAGEELILTSMSDISELKEARRRRLESEARLKLALSGADLGTWDWNVETGDVHFNRRWAEMLGYQPGEIEPHVRAWEGLLHPRDADFVMAALQRHLDGVTDEYHTEHRLRSKTGRWVWVLDRGRVTARDGRGRPLRMAGIHMDISDRKRAEEGLLHYQEHLEEIIRERTVQLERAQEELLGQAMEAGRMLALDMMLHNIGNALTPILLQAERLGLLMEDRSMDYLRSCYRELADHAGNLDDYVSRNGRGKEVFAYMGKLIETFLDEKQPEVMEALAGVRRGALYASQTLRAQSIMQQTPSPNRTTSLASLVEETLNIQSASLEKRGISLKKELDAEPVVKGNPNTLMQVLMNLIKNAYEALDEKGPAPDEKVILIRVFGGEGRSYLEISDNGTGFAPEMVGEIFSTGVSSKGSSGFGLFYSKKVVEHNGGTIAIESEGKGMGATVRLSFPRPE